TVSDFLRDWAPRIYRYALRLTGDAHAAEDLAQEALLRAWSRRSALRDERAARVWLFRIATNLWRDQLRRKASAVGRARALPDELVSAWPSPEALSEQKDELRRVLAAMNQ